MNYNAPNLKSLYAIRTTGAVRIDPQPTPTVLGGWSVAIPAADTYFFPIGSVLGGVMNETAGLGLNAIWTAALAGAMTIEVCDMPATLGDNGQGGTDIGEIDATGAWQLFNPVQAGVLWATATGAGNTMTALSLTLGGTNLGGAAWNIPDLNHRRAHLKLVASAAGSIRVLPWGKLAA